MSLFESLEPKQQALIKKHLELVIEANKSLNLTRIDTSEDGMLLHVEDSLVGLAELNEAPDGLYGDLGSGGGYPGIPLAIASGRETMLVDARQKKVRVLDDIIANLGLQSQITTYAGRAELLARTRAGEFSVVTARALAKLSVLLELASPLLKPGGHLVCYKAQVDESEIAHARELEGLTGMRLVSDRALVLGGDITRRIIVFSKVSQAQVKLPRLEGQAQKNPL